VVTILNNAFNRSVIASSGPRGVTGGGTTGFIADGRMCPRDVAMLSSA
jgi:hypothetical protein